MQIVVHFRKTSVLSFEQAPSGAQLRESVAVEEGVPAECFFLQRDGQVLRDQDVLSTHSLTHSQIPSSEMVVVRASMRLSGGKGGFGAMLKSMAKQAGSKKTTDFGACRDLSGRRLRHVNDELILKKWQEAKDRGDEFDTSGDTQTGIDMWYLSAPSWAEGFKSSNRKKYMKGRTKTRMCLDWLNARADGQNVPRRAPVWWGCPRGPRCEFAHGEDELRGDSKKAYDQQQKDERREKERQLKNTYMGAVESNQSSEEMSNMVAAGLGRVAKKTKKTISSAPSSSSSEIPFVVDSSDSKTLSVDPTSSKEKKEVELEAVGKEEIEDVGKEEKDAKNTEPPFWLQTAPSISSAISLHPGGVVECTQGFGTVMVNRDLVDAGVDKKQWYYEVELITGGLMQIGWIDSHFVTAPPATSDDDDDTGEGGGAGENGVGDDAHSWAYDGFRQMSWNAVHEVYPNTKKGKRKGAHDGSGIWKAGDIVGCLLELDTNGKSGVLSFHLNGADLGVAFGKSCETLKSSVDELLSSGGRLSPAISLEEGQSAAINIGQRPFKHNRYVSSVSVYSLLRTEETSESEAVVDLKASSPKSVKESEVTVSEAKSSEVVDFNPVDLESTTISVVGDLEAIGAAHLKAELERRGLKAGGTLQERAARLFAVKGLQQSDIPKKLLSKKVK